MPELPEVESVRLSLLPHLRGRVILDIDARRRDTVTVVGPGAKERPLPTRNAALYLLQGARVHTLRRHGKQLAILPEPGTHERVLLVHLGMSGQLFSLAPGAHFPNPTHVHIVWKLDSGARLVFRDPRRFGGVWSLPGVDALNERWALLGPDALTIGPRQLAERLARTKRPTKSALLDQRVLAGVGNIYADESLFLARISPLSIASSLPRDAVTRLARAIRAVLGKAIQAGGSSLADDSYFDADGKRGAFQLAHAVYGRSGKLCPACRTPLRSAQINNRTTVWCPSCQPLA